MVEGASHQRSEGDSIWLDFVSATDENSFVSAWLALVAGQLPDPRSGIVVFTGDEGEAARTVAAWPPNSRDGEALVPLLEKVANGQAPVIENWPEKSSYCVGYPLHVGDRIAAVIGFECTVIESSESARQSVLRSLHWGSGWLAAYLSDRTHLSSEEMARRLGVLSDFVLTALVPDKPAEVGTTITSHLAAACEADNVCFAEVKDGRCRIEAMSNRARFETGSTYVQSVEAAMNEAIDQDCVITYPLPSDAPPLMSTAHSELVDGLGGRAWLLSVPVVWREEQVGVLMFERQDIGAFDSAERALAEMAAYLSGPLLATAKIKSRSLFRHAKDSLQNTLEPWFGPHATLVRATSTVALALLAFLLLWPVTWRINAQVVLEGAELQAQAAPISGILREAPFRAGDRVAEGDLLVKFDQRELTLERLRLLSEQQRIIQEQRGSLANVDRTQARILTARLDQVAADMALVDRKISLTEIHAPFEGILVSGDWSQKIGSPIDQGVVLFEMAPANNIRIVALVDERDIATIESGQVGALRLQAMPNETLAMAVVKMTPVAQTKDGLNVFRVEGRLEATEDDMARLRPGMEGVAKIEVGGKSLMGIWTRRLSAWLRITFWEYLP